MSITPTLDDAARSLCEIRGYEFGGELGKGAFKSAYLGKQGEQSFAIKIATISGAVDRLTRETAALQECAHTSIARLIDAFPHRHKDRELWVVLEEFIPGGTLEERLKTKRIDPESVRHIGICLAEVLEHLQQRKLVHRDIKPANVLFREDGTPVLTDFGIVRMLDKPTLTHAFMAMGPGTPAYAAPEQLTNEKTLIDWRTDQFGLAIVLAECLLGHHPYLDGQMSLHDAISAVAAKQNIPESSRQKLADLGFQSVVQALCPWPIARHRRPSNFIAAIRHG